MSIEDARSENLSRKKRVGGGHRASASHMIGQVREVIELSTDRETVITRLKQYKRSLEEKLETIKQLDETILELVSDEEINDEIEQADVFRERVQMTILEATAGIESRGTPQVLLVTLLSRLLSHLLNVEASSVVSSIAHPVQKLLL